MSSTRGQSSLSQYEGDFSRQLVREQGWIAHHPFRGQRHLHDQVTTDSRHYLLPLDEVQHQEDLKKETDRAKSMESENIISVQHSSNDHCAKSENVISVQHSSNDHGEKFNSGNDSSQGDHDTVSEYERKFQMPIMYCGDHYPDGIDDQKRQKLDQQYRAIKEEFYTKSGQMSVTPENYHQWRTTRRASKHCQFWEIFSGSGRLSYIALLAGLATAFPVDFRYGWNMADPRHQKLIMEAQDMMKPDVIFMAPSCGPWSVSSNRLSDDDRERLREEERSTLQFVKKLAIRQAEAGRGFLLRILGDPLCGDSRHWLDWNTKSKAADKSKGAISASTALSTRRASLFRKPQDFRQTFLFETPLIVAEVISKVTLTFKLLSKV